MAENNDQPIEIDTSSETDSAFADDAASYTTSLASSIKRHEFRNGRRYHSNNSETTGYHFPNDEPEQDRLDLMSHLTNMIMDDQLYLAPIENPKRILDMGTGTGIWAIDMAERFPDAEVVGNDLTPIQPQWVPPNISFEIDNIEDPWPPRAPFDLIHSRYLCCAIRDWPRLISHCFAALSPGGILELQDWDITPYTDDASMPDTEYVKRMYDLLKQACRADGTEPCPGAHLKRWITEAGFVDVHERVYKVPLGTWPKDERLKKIGTINRMQFEDGLEGFLLGPYTRFLGWSSEEVQAFLAGVRRDSRLKERHRLFNFHVVWARKPEA